MIAMVVTMITLMAEAWFIGHLGTEALAGLALGFPMMMLVMMLSGGSFGGTITGAVARRLGAGDRAGAEVVALHAVLLMVLLAGACTLVFLLGGRWIYSLLGGRGPVLAQALAYSDMLFLGCVAMWLANGLAAVVAPPGTCGSPPWAWWPDRCPGHRLGHAGIRPRSVSSWASRVQPPAS
jgi:Na+-driven multidrug efflux pump